MRRRGRRVADALKHWLARGSRKRKAWHRRSLLRITRKAKNLPQAVTRRGWGVADSLKHWLARRSKKDQFWRRRTLLSADRKANNLPNPKIFLSRIKHRRVNRRRQWATFRHAIRGSIASRFRLRFRKREVCDAATKKWMPLTRTVFGVTKFRNPFPASVHVASGESWGHAFHDLHTLLAFDTLPDKLAMAERYPVVSPSFLQSDEDSLCVTWLGHASLCCQMEGVNVLFDPVLNGDNSAVSLTGNARLRPPPCSVADLPQIHSVLLSHNHYDHLDETTISALHHRWSDIQYVVPLGLAATVRAMTGPEAHVVEMGWWDTHRVETRAGTLEVTATPAQHWSTRTFWDTNQTLWCGYTVQGRKFGKKFYFAGDTGYCGAFKSIGHHLGPMDLSALPIGAYAPRIFFRNVHMNPAEAVRVHEEVRSAKSIAVHYATFQLSSENVFEPGERLNAAVAAAPKQTDFFCLAHGDTVTV